MNAERRKQITAIKDQLDDLMADIESAQTEEQDAFDAMPESLQASERGEASQSAIDALSNAASYLSDAAGELDNAIA